MEQVADRNLREHFQVRRYGGPVEQIADRGLQEHFQVIGWRVAVERVERRFQQVMIGASESTASVERNCTIGQ